MTRKYYMCWEHPSHRVNTLTYITILSFPSILENYLCIPPNSPLVSMLAIALLYSANDLHNKYTILNLHNRVLIPLAYPSMELILLAHIHQCQVFYQKLKCTMKVLVTPWESKTQMVHFIIFLCFSYINPRHFKFRALSEES